METSNLFFKTLIVEDKPTVNRHIYRKGFLQKIKDKLQDGIENRKCFVTFNHAIDTSTDTMLKKGLLAGVVISFEIENGQGTIEVFPLKGALSGDRLISYDNKGIFFNIDLLIQGILEDTVDKNGNSYVSMDDFDVEPILVLVRDNEKK